jgi:hypothetical protein
MRLLRRQAAISASQSSLAALTRIVHKAIAIGARIGFALPTPHVSTLACCLGHMTVSYQRGTYFEFRFRASIRAWLLSNPRVPRLPHPRFTAITYRPVICSLPETVLRIFEEQGTELIDGVQKAVQCHCLAARKSFLEHLQSGIVASY